MKRLSTLVMLAALCGGPAQAAQFLLLNIDTDSDDPYVMLTDTRSIAPGESGHKLATIITAMNDSTWDESKEEFDCAGKRKRQLSFLVHDYDTDKTSTNAPDSAWRDTKDGSVFDHVRETICGWPGKQPDANQILEQPDQNAMLGFTFDRLDQLVKDSKKAK